jgi:UDP-N-acetylmuramate dehydrogenase
MTVNHTQKIISLSQLNHIKHLGTVYCDKNLAEFSRWKIGGTADAVIAPHSAEAIAQLMTFVSRERIPYVVIGSSSNLLFADEGVRALVILLGNQISEIKISGNRVSAQCGLWVPRFSRSIAQAGLAGAEHMIGIPGTLGGLICMNGGSQRKGVGDFLVSARSVSPEGELVQFKKAQCDFAYRESVFQRNHHIIVDAEFEYPLADNQQDVRRNMLSILRDRRLKFPKKLPNCGSVFVSDPAMYTDYGPPGAVIERCGLKGLTRNKAQISPMHANFIVNNGGASANDVLYLIHVIREMVQKETGYLMPAEARYVSPSGEIIVAHERAQQLYA